MIKNLWDWFRIKYSKIINSIAFIPAFIAILFLALSALMILFDYSETGKQLKEDIGWLSLKDASTARSIIQAIVTGIISLAVFSFSMVMIVLNQAASYLSNRVLDKLIGNRFQQLILGIYLGTIVYGLALLTTRRDIDSGIYVPALSTYFLIILTVVDIFLFIYFLHYITQSVKYETIIDRICMQTKHTIEKKCTLREEPDEPEKLMNGKLILSPRSGVYEGFHEKYLLDFCKQHNIVISLLHTPGTFLIMDTPLITIQGKNDLDENFIKQLLTHVHITNNETIEANYLYGFRQLMEIAVKGLSPGQNDPGTAVEALRAISDLLHFRINLFPHNSYKDDNGIARILAKQKSFNEIFNDTLLPIWDYGKNDRILQKELLNILKQLKVSNNSAVEQLFSEVQMHLAEYKLRH